MKLEKWMLTQKFITRWEKKTWIKLDGNDFLCYKIIEISLLLLLLNFLFLLCFDTRMWWMFVIEKNNELYL